MVKLGKIPVTICDIFTIGKRTFAEVKAVMGEPFIDYSMGGPVRSAFRTVRIEFLKTEGTLIDHASTIAKQVPEWVNC